MQAIVNKHCCDQAVRVSFVGHKGKFKENFVYCYSAYTLSYFGEMTEVI